MAFVSLLFVYLLVIIVVVCITTSIAIIFFIISAVLKKRQPDKKKRYMIPRVIGFIFMVPLILCIGVILYACISSAIHKKISLAYNLENLNTAQMEKIIDRGVSPDCTIDSNDAASNGEKTLLYLLAEGMLHDEWKTEGESEESIHETTLEMMRFLIEKGADVNYCIYHHKDKNSQIHEYTDKNSIYLKTDQCGWTPLMEATYRADLDMIKLLIENGADVHAVDYCGYNVINIIADSLGDEEGYEILNYYLELGVDAGNITNYHQDAVWLAQRNRAGSFPLENDKILAALQEQVR